ncbi:MAG: glycosyltransferase, partial [Caulobacteraceae bacterium]
ELAARFADRKCDWSNLVVYRTALVAALPGDRRAKVALVRALVRIKSTSEALALVDQLLKDDPVGAGFRRLRLEVLLAAGDTRAAIEQWRALAANPAEESVNYVSEVAQILAEAGQYRMATDWVAGAQRRHGNPPALARLIATFAYRAGAWDEAERLWRDLAETGDDNTRKAAGIFRARIATGAGRMVDATAHYREAFKNDEANEEAARHLVRVAIAEGRLETAAGLIGRLEGRAGRTAMATGLKARLAMARGDSTAALTEFRQGLADHPADVDLRRGLADLYGHLGDYDSMDEVLAAAEALAPRDPAILSRRLTAGANRLAPPAQLLAIADRLLALRPHDQGVLRQKANLLIRLGERREAVAVLIEAIDRGPSNVSAWTAVISNLLTLNDGEQAAAFVERARRVFSGQSAGDLLALAEILESGDLGGEAAGLAERAVALAPDSGAARVTAARLWEGRGLYRRAWPHLLALRDLDAAPGRGTLTFARVARALSYVDAHPVAGAENDQFPDAVFDRIARLARPRPVAGTEPMVFQVTSSLAAGGSERQVALTIQGLAAAPDALRPELVAQDMNPLTARDFFLPIVEATGAPVWVLAEMRGEGLVREAATAGAGARGDLGLLGALPTDVANVALPLYSLIAERRPRAVHLWQDAIVVAGGIAAMLAGVPRIVLSTRSTRPIERQRARPYLKAGYDALLRYPGTVMLNNSKNGARDYADWLAIDPARIGTLYNGFVFDELRARADPILTAEIRRRLAAGKEDVVIGGIMRCSFEKRPDLWADTVIDLAGRDPRVRGLLVGEGPMRAELQEKATSLGLGDKIQFVGRQTPVESWIGAMDLLFLSSVTEGLPNVLIEAQALGVAVATMRVGGAPETVVENQTALVIDEGSAAEVAQAMAPLVFDPARREQFGAAGVSWTRATFGLDAAMARLSAIYAEDGPAR